MIVDTVKFKEFSIRMLKFLFLFQYSCIVEQIVICVFKKKEKRCSVAWKGLINGKTKMALSLNISNVMA